MRFLLTIPGFLRHMARKRVSILESQHRTLVRHFNDLCTYVEQLEQRMGRCEAREQALVKELSFQIKIQQQMQASLIKLITKQKQLDRIEARQVELINEAKEREPADANDLLIPMRG